MVLLILGVSPLEKKRKASKLMNDIVHLNSLSKVLEKKERFSYVLAVIYLSFKKVKNVSAHSRFITILSPLLLIILTEGFIHYYQWQIILHCLWIVYVFKNSLKGLSQKPRDLCHAFFFNSAGVKKKQKKKTPCEIIITCYEHFVYRFFHN